MARGINSAGLDLIKNFEGFRDTAYQDQGGLWTIGFGHTKGVCAGMTCTEDEATDWLNNDLANAEDGVERIVTVNLGDNQFAALVSFAFNVGLGNFANSTLVHLLNQGYAEQVPTQLMRWTRVAGVENAGLARRRAAEGALWNTPDGDA